MIKLNNNEIIENLGEQGLKIIILENKDLKLSRQAIHIVFRWILFYCLILLELKTMKK
jgi:hypothetical protein